MSKLISSFFLAVLLMLHPASAQDRPTTPEAVIERLFDERLDTSLLAPSFLQAIPEAQLSQLLAEMKRTAGALVAVTGTAPDLRLEFERAVVNSKITLDAEGRVAGLWFDAPTPKGGYDEIAREIEALPGETSLLVVSGGKVRTGHNADRPLAVGSAFKLAILAALDKKVAAGGIAWEDVVPLDPQRRSLPSGILQSWPDATPLTVATLANLMISQSDNTATDMLLHLVGREEVQAETPRNTPFLSTREAFILKADKTLADQWVGGDAMARQALLALIEDYDLPAPDAIASVIQPQVEWFLTAEELCALLDRTADLAPFRIEPGLARGGPWSSVAYKGGSEPGVLNLSTRMTAKDGTAHCVVATWNDGKPLDEAKLFGLYRGLLAELAAGR